MNGLNREAEKFSKYGVIGLGTNSLLYFLFIGLVMIGIHPVTTAGLCYILGLLLSYVLNRRWTFSSTNAHHHDLPRFLVAYGAGLATTLVTIVILIRWLPPSIAQIINIGITAVVIYTMLRVLQFGTTDSDNVH